MAVVTIYSDFGTQDVISYKNNWSNWQLSKNDNYWDWPQVFNSMDLGCSPGICKFNKLPLFILFLIFQISQFKKNYENLFWISHLRYCLFSLSFTWFAISRHSQYILHNYGEKWWIHLNLRVFAFTCKL